MVYFVDTKLRAARSNMKHGESNRVALLRLRGWEVKKRKFRNTPEFIAVHNQHGIYKMDWQQFRPFDYPHIMQLVLDELKDQGHVVKQRIVEGELYQVVILYKKDGELHKFKHTSEFGHRAACQAIHKLLKWHDDFE